MTAHQDHEHTPGHHCNICKGGIGSVEIDLSQANVPSDALINVHDRNPGAAERIIDQSFEVVKAIQGLSLKAAKDRSDMSMKDGKWTSSNPNVDPESVKYVVVELDRADLSALPEGERKSLAVSGHTSETAAVCTAQGALIDFALSNPERAAGDPEFGEFRFTSDIKGMSFNLGDKVVGVLPKNGQAVKVFVAEHGGAKHYDLSEFK